LVRANGGDFNQGHLSLLRDKLEPEAFKNKLRCGFPFYNGAPY